MLFLHQTSTPWCQSQLVCVPIGLVFHVCLCFCAVSTCMCVGCLWERAAQLQNILSIFFTPTAVSGADVEESRSATQPVDCQQGRSHIVPSCLSSVEVNGVCAMDTCRRCILCLCSMWTGWANDHYCKEECLKEKMGNALYSHNTNNHTNNCGAAVA